MLVAQELNGRGHKVSYVNMEGQRIRFEDGAWDQLLAWFGDQEGWLLLDEVTSMNGWEAFLARAHELRKDRIRIILLVPGWPFHAPARAEGQGREHRGLSP